MVNFCEQRFDTKNMEAPLLKNKLKNRIKEVIKLLEKRNSATQKELQLLVGLFFSC